MIVKVLAAFLLLVSAYLGWWAVSSAAPFWLVPAVVSLVAAIGLLRGRRWAQYLWYAMSAIASLLWVFSVVHLALSGWPHETVLASAISLTPGLLLLLVCVGGSIVIARHFRGGASAL